MMYFAEYHNVLIKNGVEDYDFNTLVEEFEMMVVEQTMATLGMANMMKPKTFTKVLKSAQDNEEKTAQIKDFENGFYSKVFIALTCMYLNNKEGFLSVDE